MTLRTRALTGEEWARYHVHISDAFLETKPTEEVPVRELFPGDRMIAVVDGDDRLIGGGGVQTRDMTVVGTGPAPVAAVSYVGVRPDTRRRGVLRTLMRAQLAELHATAAEPVAALWATMAGIYGRFGYGIASRSGRLTVPGRAGFHPGAPEGDPVRWLDGPEAAGPIREVHRRAAERRVGWLTRAEANWRWWLADPEGSFRYAVAHGAHAAPAGYAVFRVHPDWTAAGPEHRMEVKELVATGPAAHVGLWRALLDVDMVSSVRHWNVALDDPTTSLLVSPRATLTDVRDALWVRLVDLDRALAARRYAGPCELVLEVTDGFCAWNAGRWRLTVADTGAAVLERTSAEPDLGCDVADLGAAYLGGTRLAALAAAGRVRELRAGAVATASRAFTGDTEPYCPEVF